MPFLFGGVHLLAAFAAWCVGHWSFFRVKLYYRCTVVLFGCTTVQIGAETAGQLSTKVEFIELQRRWRLTGSRSRKLLALALDR